MQPPTSTIQAPSQASTIEPLRALFAVCLGLLLMGMLGANPVADDGRGSAFSFKASANLCGLSEARQLSNPARVDHGALLEITPEISKIRAEKIAPSSAEGARLMAAARKRVLDACKEELTVSGHCSIWKQIKRRDGSEITDVTSAVRKRIAASLTR